ncbi:NPFFR2 [Acanthosepion pharaonis]|uniref:NPFFR2 n=1 Tax=Acanthosepion pharaonis TaxID=158019 RepID=A0A812CXK6_ACAPH|nr:NPFFR2 [Sepia pharaonis]
MLFFHDNNSRIYTLEELNAKKASFASASTIYMAILMVVGMIGNSLVLYVYGKRFRSSSTNSFILALSTFDIINCAIGMPTEIVDDQLPLMFSWEFGCKVLRFISFFSSGGSCFTLVIIALDRFQRVCLGRAQMQAVWAKVVIVLVTIVAAVAVGPIIELAGIDTESTDVPYINTCDCAISDVYKKTKWPLIYFTYLSGMIGLSLIIIVATYTMIGLTVKRRLGKRNLKGKTVVKTMADINREQDRKMRSEKTTKTFFLVTVLFIISYIPCSMIQLLRALTGFEPHTPRTEILVNVGLRSYFLANAFNPFIYGYCNHKFREICVTLLVDLQVTLMEEPRTKAHVYSLTDPNVSLSQRPNLSVTDTYYQ